VLSVLAVVTVEIIQRRRSQFITNNFWVLAHVSLEKFLKKLLGRNDVEDALKRLDKLTQEEANIVTVEVLKSTRNVYDNVAMLIDGIQSKLFSCTCCPDGLLSPDDKEARAIIEQEKRSLLFLLLSRLLLEAKSWSQESKCDETSTAGFLPWIPQQIMKLLAMLIMTEQPPGSFRVVFLKNGGQLLRFCGYMANVRSCPSLALSTSHACILCSGLRQECTLVGNISIVIEMVD
jgi:hypothetical protein